MALLTIAEPGQTPAPHARRLAIGIDLGTTNSLVASVINGVPECLADEAGEVILPSAVHVAEDGAITVGREAKARAASDPEHTFLSIKRLMGRGMDDARQMQPRPPYRFIEGEDAVPRMATPRGPLSAIEISAEILKTLRPAPRRAWVESSPARSSLCPPISTKPSARPPGMPRAWPACTCCAC